MNLQHMLKSLVQVVTQSTEEVAAGHEQALQVTTNLAKSEMKELGILARETGATIAELKDSIVSDIARVLMHQLTSKRLLFPAIVSLGERQDSLDKVSKQLN